MLGSFFIRKNKSQHEIISTSESVICVGSSSKDVFFPTDKGLIIDTPQDIISQKKIAFELGAKYQVEERFESVGGCAANVAMGLAKLNIKAYCYTKIGNDFIGEWIIDELTKNGVAVDFVQKGRGCRSDLSMIVVDTKIGDRVIFSDRDANEKLKINPKEFQKAQWVFISSLNGDWQNNLKKIFLSIKSKKNKIVFNPGQKNITTDVKAIIDAIAHCEILILNKDEALEIVSGIKLGMKSDKLNDEKFLLESLRQLGPQTVLITDGIKGAWANNGDDIFHAAAIIVQALDTTGAGDAFSSGFLAGIINKKSLKESLAWGIVNSSNSVMRYGGQVGLISKNEIEKQIKTVKIEKIN